MLSDWLDLPPDVRDFLNSHGKFHRCKQRLSEATQGRLPIQHLHQKDLAVTLVLPSGNQYIISYHGSCHYVMHVYKKFGLWESIKNLSFSSTTWVTCYTQTKPGGRYTPTFQPLLAKIRCVILTSLTSPVQFINCSCVTHVGECKS